MYDGFFSAANLSFTRGTSGFFGGSGWTTGARYYGFFSAAILSVTIGTFGIAGASGCTTGARA